MTNVLIVDDDYGTQLLLRALVETQCCDWRLAESYEEAEFDLEWAEVAIVDVHLPTRSGLEVVSRLREQNPRCRIVVLSGDDSAETAAIERGADHFIAKPFEISDFFEAMSGETTYIDVRRNTLASVPSGR